MRAAAGRRRLALTARACCNRAVADRVARKRKRKARRTKDNARKQKPAAPLADMVEEGSGDERGVYSDISDPGLSDEGAGSSAEAEGDTNEIGVGREAGEGGREIAAGRGVEGAAGSGQGKAPAEVGTGHQRRRKRRKVRGEGLLRRFAWCTRTRMPGSAAHFFPPSSAASQVH